MLEQKGVKKKRLLDVKLIREYTKMFGEFNIMETFKSEYDKNLNQR